DPFQLGEDLANGNIDTIPDECMYNDSEVRLRFLLGFIDALNSYNRKGDVEIIKFDERTIEFQEDIKFLIESLGGTAMKAVSYSKDTKINALIPNLKFINDEEPERRIVQIKYTGE